ncbi:MAG: pilus assembly protein [Burkholderiaceae bacterium]|nr:pilus assembly protein [Burkholderiaceae bacterium]
MVSPLWRARWRATLIHLGASGLVAALAAALVFEVWYPHPYELLAGGLGLFGLLTGVDVVLGPLITLVIYDARKRRVTLQRDLAVVVSLQLAALAYGLNTMAAARPVALALEIDRFRVVAAVDVVRQELPLAPAALRRLPLTGPVLLRTTLPADGDAKLEAIQRALGGQDLGVRPKFWQPWDDTARRQLRQAAKPVATLQRADAQRAAAIDRAVAATGLPASQVGVVPLLARRAGGVVLVNRDSGEVAGFGLFATD